MGTVRSIGRYSACSLARVAAVTGNPVLDVGTQCADLICYFQFRNGASGHSCFTVVPPREDGTVRAVDVFGEETWDSGIGRGLLKGMTLNREGEDYEYVAPTPWHPGGYVNQWSLYKPMIHDSVAALEDEQMKGVSYGYDIPVFQSYDALETAISYGHYKWGYNHPYIGQTMRLSDFCGYNRDATPFPVLSFMSGSKTPGSTVTLGAGIPETNTENLLGVEDILGWSAFDVLGVKRLYWYVPGIGICWIRHESTDDPAYFDFSALGASLDKTYFGEDEYDFYLVVTDCTDGASGWYNPRGFGYQWMVLGDAPLHLSLKLGSDGSVVLRYLSVEDV